MQLTGLTDRVAVITGASGGLGRAVAERLAIEGVRLALVDPDQRALDRVARQLQPIAPQVLARASDVSRPGQAERVARKLAAELGAVHMLVNAFGCAVRATGGDPPPPRRALEDIDDDAWTALQERYLASTFYACRAFVPWLKRNGGRIVNFAAAGARGGEEHVGAHHAAAKAGVMGLTRALAVELGPFGITVNAIAPGEIAERGETDWNRPSSLLQQEAQRLAHTLLGRVGRPAEVADVVALLLSDAGGYVSGAVIDVNGGQYLAP